MPEIVSLIPELEQLLRHSSDARRSETLRRITDLFLEDAGRFGPDHVELFDDVFTRLVVEIETEARALLAQRLAPCANAPERIVTRLAQDDDITVAGRFSCNPLGSGTTICSPSPRPRVRRTSWRLPAGHGLTRR